MGLQSSCNQNVPTLNGSKVDNDDFFHAVPIEDVSSADIGLIRAVNINADLAQCGVIPLRHRSLNDPPKLGAIKDVYSSVLGDCWHGIDCLRIPMYHAYKKRVQMNAQGVGRSNAEVWLDGRPN